MPHLPGLCLLLMLTHAPAALAQAETVAASPEDVPDWEVPTRHIVLRAEQARPAAAHRVQVSPGRATALLFDAPLSHVEVRDAEQFGRVRLDEDTLTLVPSKRLAEGLEVPLVAHFRDDAAPAQADFLLVVHAAVAERQVSVERQPRHADSFYAELREKDARIQQLTAEVERLRGERRPPGGFVGALIASIAAQGVPALNLDKQVRQRPRNAAWARTVFTLRGTASAVIHMKLDVPRAAMPQAAAPWQVEGAMLVGGDGAALPVLTVWQEAPISPGTPRFVIVEVAFTPATPLGPYTLTLWAAGGLRSVVLGNLVIPAMPDGAALETPARR